MNTETIQPEAGFSEDVLILTLARGASYRQAALESGCGLSTVARRQQDQKFRAKVTKCRGEILSRSCGILAGATVIAVKKLRQLCQSQNQVVALAASKAVLELANRYRDQLELLERLEVLEHRSDES